MSALRIKSWWKTAVIYQIYPASFCDSNGDGIGDLAGIVSKLDYIRALGADVVWLSPMYDSPQVDMGYDIADYEAVYAPYGTLADMDTLIREAHARGMRVLLDLVINHTSDQHAWFKESRSSKESVKRDWYIWRPATYDAVTGARRPPNNWRSFFGKDSAWTWDETTQEYYLHLFAAEQPDFNWENDTARRALYETSMTFWLKRGVDGFRVDVVNTYSKPAGLPDAPVTDPGAATQPCAMLVCNGPRMHEFLREIRRDILAPYNAITVGELGMTPDPDAVRQYVSAASQELDMVFQFDVVMVGHSLFGNLAASNASGEGKSEADPTHHFALPTFKAAVGATQTLIAGNDAWTTVFLENHDQARSVSRFANDSPRHRVASARLLALLQACLSGTQYIYQGQEIGLVNAPADAYPVDNYLDLVSQRVMQGVAAAHADSTPEVRAQAMARAFAALQYAARDHSRIPIPWNGAAKYGGFSEAAGQLAKEPWMKPHPLAGEINVAAQLDDPDSALAFWRKMVALRRAHPDLLVYSDYRALREADEDLMVFVKNAVEGDDHGKVLVVLNFSTDEVAFQVPDAEELGFADKTASVTFASLASTHKADAPVGDVLAPLEGRAYIVKA
ncbi:hypothetical protein SCUCBS95973_007438 [Sporothrix curviconia]|uniref:Glycosyl hydrolase family 13 catalytic domain-containing protein n=1 Tax=Sporothrix curviconia TaxID=1260050 RepID=A0ABP0CDB7_9PEZI